MPRTRNTRFGLVLLLALTLVSGGADAARSNWRVMNVGQFRVFSTMGDASTRTVARELQAYSQTVGQMLRASDPLPDIPTRVYLLTYSDFHDFVAKSPTTIGLFRDTPSANVVVIDASQPFDVVKRVIFSEFTNGILRDSRSLLLPMWYSVGYSELFSSFRMKGNDVFVGEVPAQLHVSTRGRDWIPVEHLLSMTRGDPLFKDSDKSMQYRGESWALVHLLLFDSPELARPTADYFSQMNVSFPEPEAFTRSFPFDKAALDGKLKLFVSRGLIQIKKLTYATPVSVETAEIRPLTPLQADTEITRVAYLVGRPQSSVSTLAAGAVKDDPSDPHVRALAARVAARAKEAIDVADLAERLANGGKEDEDIRVDVSDALLTAKKSQESATKALAILDGVVHGDRPSIEAVRYWAYAGCVAKSDPAGVVAVVQQASARAPHDTYLLKVLAVASERLRRPEDARAYYLRVMEVSLSPAERLWAQKQADSARLQPMEALASRDDLAPPPSVKAEAE